MVHNVMVYMSIFTSQRRMSAFWLGIYDEETIDTAREVAMMEYTVFFYINFYIGNLLFKICKIIAVVVFMACQFLREYLVHFCQCMKHILNLLNILIFSFLPLDSTISHVESKQCNLPFASGT